MLRIVAAESVELATILLTDVVGSTRLATSVGPVRADELREEHFALLRDAIVSSGGREVKNTGDGLMVAFSSTSAAVECAVSMQQLLERRYRDAEQSLHVRIGLAAGESTVKDGDYFGVPSTEATRLCDQAPGDGILVSGLAKALAGRCDGIEFCSEGEIELKGFSDPVEAFSVTWAPLGREDVGVGGWPLPAVLRSVPPVAYVGRVEERSALAEARVLARGGSRQVVLLSGEPGIGKTRLSSYAAHQAHAQGFAVCWGSCSEELAVPYEPWIAVCSQLVEHSPKELLHRRVERHGGELGRLARNLSARVPALPEPQSSDPETERYLLFSAVVGFIEEVAREVPLCVVLDDLHWADPQSVALLKHLLRALEQGALQVIATFRDSDLGKDHPLTAVLADLRSLEGVQRVALHGLGADEVAQIVTAVVGHELEADALELAARIAAETDGNPFFVGEILRGLSESGALVFDEGTGRWSIDDSAPITMPESVREVIEHRVERLGEQSLEALRLAAVIGREFDLELLSAILETDEARLLDPLEGAVAASLLAESSERVGRFRFVHALISQTLYEGLGATRRARMHQRVAEALEDLYGSDPGEHLAALALHWRLAAVPVNRAKAAGYALKAGRQALDNLAPADALKLFSDAVELTGHEDGPERCEAQIGLGDAQRLTGDSGFRETLLEASRIASTLEDAGLAARAALANNRGYASVIFAVDAERLAAIARAIELDKPRSPARRARLLALQAQELLWDADFARRRALAEEAIALARRSDDKRTLAEVLRGAHTAMLSAQTLELRAALAEEIAGCAEELGDPALRYHAYSIGLHVHIERGGEPALAQAILERMWGIATVLGHDWMRWSAAVATTGLQLLQGELAAAERLAKRALEIGQETGQPDALVLYGVQLMFVRLYQGRGEEIVSQLEQAVKAYPTIAAWRAVLASTLCWSERREEAAAILERAASDRFEHVLPLPNYLTAVVLYADAAAQTSDAGAAATLYGLIEPFAGRVAWTGGSGQGHARLYLGLLASVLGEHERADEHLAFACDFHEANAMPIWAARGHLGWAVALAERGDAVGAREHATRALELSREHGYGAFEPQAAALLQEQPAKEARRAQV